MDQLLVIVMVLALVLGLAVLIRRRGRAPPAVVFEKIIDPAIAHRALVDNADAFSDRPAQRFLVALANTRGGGHIETLNSVLYGPHWHALRRNITAETLHPSRLHTNLAPLQRDATRDLVAALSATASPGEKVVIVRDHVYAAVFAVVARLCLGDACSADVGAMGSAIRDWQLAAGGGPEEDSSSTLGRLVQWWRMRRLLVLRRRIRELFVPLIAAARQRPCDDGGRRSYLDSLVGLLVPDGGKDDRDQRGLRDDEIVGAAGETLRGMPYLNAVVLESLRMHPPVPFLPRQVQAHDAAGVLTITAAPDSGDQDRFVEFVVGEIARDKKTWTDPDVFRPERFMAGGEGEGVGPLPGPKEMRMMPFGAGHRFCPGMGMAMANIKCFLASLVQEFEWAPAPGCGGVDLTELDDFFKYMKTPLCARVKRCT